MKNSLIPVFAVILIGCGDAADPFTPVGGEAGFPNLPVAEPLALTDVDVAVGVHHGSAIGFAHYGGSSVETLRAAMPHVFLWVQAYDEAAQTVGEYHVNPSPVGVNARTATDFLGANVANGNGDRRAEDFANEIDAAESHAGIEPFTSRSYVFDFWRLRRDWWVRWDGTLDQETNRKGQGPYGFYREEFVDDLLGRIQNIAEDQQPRYLVVGHEMERLIQNEDRDGFAPAEFSNFVSFYQQALERIRAKSPDTKVGFGINWDRFVGAVAPLYGDEDEDPLLCLDRAFEAVLLPLLERSDIIALESYSETERTDTSGYEYLRRLEQRHQLTLPVVWYSVGQPVTSVVNYQKQRNYLESFLTWNAGIPVETIAWRSLLNFEGTDTNDQQIAGRCRTFTSEDKKLEMPVVHCYDGLFTSVFSGKATLDIFQE
jgi:hypothetical protein